MSVFQITGIATPWMKDLGLFLIRAVFGGAMLFGHGLGKWQKLFQGDTVQFADPFSLGPSATLGLVVIAEVICALFVMAGLLTRLALIPLIINMMVALIVIHGSDSFATQEKALLYGAVFVGLMISGPGKISVDTLIKGI